jgi:hypothetical protein
MVAEIKTANEPGSGGYKKHDSNPATVENIGMSMTLI